MVDRQPVTERRNASKDVVLRTDTLIKPYGGIGDDAQQPCGTGRYDSARWGPRAGTRLVGLGVAAPP